MTLAKFSWTGEVAHVDTKAEPPPKHWRPSTRADCVDGPRPCPYVGCRHHLAMHVDGEDISRSGGRGRGTRTLSAMLARGGTVDDWGDSMLDMIETMTQTCALDVAKEGGLTHEDVGSLLGVSKQRSEQIQEDGLVKLRKRVGIDGLGELLEAISSGRHIEGAMVEAQGYASLEPGDVAAMREAKG